MNTIEEKAKEYANEVNGELGEELYHDSEYTRNEITETDFLAGYNTAFEWISVDEELPNSGQEVLVKIDYIDENKEIETYLDLYFWDNSALKFTEIKVTHWRPIEIN